MTKIFVLGNGPLFEKGVRSFGAQGLRTWFFTKPLLEDGHALRLRTLALENATDPETTPAKLLPRRFEGFDYAAFDNSHFQSIRETLRLEIEEYRPDVLVGVNTLSAWVLSMLPFPIPLWADLNGYEMAEKQAQAARMDDDAYLESAWRLETQVARRADKFSTVSKPQHNALLGELALLGRMNQYTFRYHFAHHIPNAFHPAFAAAAAGGVPRLRGKVVPGDAFLLLMSGVYNYWMDPRFLFACLERAMAEQPRLHFVSTGGGIAPYNTKTYEDFQGLVEGSPHRGRYHLLGWLPAEELPGLYAEMDLGLNIDEPNYETLFGARNRLTNMMAAGLPVLTTFGSEISRIIEETRCGLVCPPGDEQALAAAIGDILRAPEQLRKLGRRSRELALEQFAPEVVTAPLREWVHAPAAAPDNAEKLRRAEKPGNPAHLPLNYLEELALAAARDDLTALQRDFEDLRAIRAKGWYRALRAGKHLLRRLIPAGRAGE